MFWRVVQRRGVAGGSYINNEKRRDKNDDGYDCEEKLDDYKKTRLQGDSSQCNLAQRTAFFVFEVVVLDKQTYEVNLYP